MNHIDRCYVTAATTRQEASHGGFQYLVAPPIWRVPLPIRNVAPPDAVRGQSSLLPRRCS